MKYKLIPLDGVDNDVGDAVEWYDFKQQGLGEQFLDDWESTVAFILSNPLAFSKKNKSFRHASLKVFPYLIIYEVTENLIVIYAVINAKRHPKKRYTRKKQN
jgi:hypothetical protein